MQSWWNGLIILESDINSERPSPYKLRDSSYPIGPKLLVVLNTADCRLMFLLMLLDVNAILPIASAKVLSTFVMQTLLQRPWKVVRLHFSWGKENKTILQTWALEVFLNFFNNKKWFLAYFIKLIWLGVGFLNRICAEIVY